MKRILQVLLILIAAGVYPLHAQNVPVQLKNAFRGTYKAPQIKRGFFPAGLAMENNERNEYALNLASLAVKVIRAEKGSQPSLDKGRRLLALALHLSPRNKKALVVNAQLKKGVMPKEITSDYGTDVFARLLLARGQLLEKQEGKPNALLSRYFIELAAMIDPKNEDAIYESELHRIDHGKVPWKLLTDGKLELEN